MVRTEWNSELKYAISNAGKLNPKINNKTKSHITSITNPLIHSKFKSKKLSHIACTYE